MGQTGRWVLAGGTIIADGPVTEILTSDPILNQGNFKEAGFNGGL